MPKFCNNQKPETPQNFKQATTTTANWTIITKAETNLPPNNKLNNLVWHSFAIIFSTIDKTQLKFWNTICSWLNYDNDKCQTLQGVLYIVYIYLYILRSWRCHWLRHIQPNTAAAIEIQMEKQLHREAERKGNWFHNLIFIAINAWENR